MAYDDLLTNAATRYVLWKIVFDHSQSIAGSDANPATCDGAGLPLNFDVASTDVLLTSNQIVRASLEPLDSPTHWNGGLVPVRPVTWGKIKGLYR